MNGDRSTTLEKKKSREGLEYGLVERVNVFGNVQNIQYAGEWLEFVCIDHRCDLCQH